MKWSDTDKMTFKWTYARMFPCSPVQSHWDTDVVSFKWTTSIIAGRLFPLLCLLTAIYHSLFITGSVWRSLMSVHLLPISPLLVFKLNCLGKKSWAAQQPTPTALSPPHHLIRSYIDNTLPSPWHLQPRMLQNLGQPYQTPKHICSFSSLVCVYCMHGAWILLHMRL